MNKISWMQVLVFGLVVLFAFLVGLSLLPMFFGYGWSGIMGRGSFMGGWCPWFGGIGFFGTGLIGSLFRALFVLSALIIPIGLLALLILGIVWLARNLSGLPSSAQTCPHCGKPVQTDWRNCPYCGEPL